MVNIGLKITPEIRTKISMLCRIILRVITLNPLGTKGRTPYDEMSHLKYDKRTHAA